MHNENTKRPLKNKRIKGTIAHCAFFDKKINKYVRKNMFNTVEYLDPETYKESLQTEKYYNELIEKYLDECQPRKKKSKLRNIFFGGQSQ